MRVDQVLCAAGPVDAVTGQALAYRRLLRDLGWTGGDYAPVQAAGMPAGTVAPLHALSPGRADVLVVHYSGYAPGLDQVIGAARRTLLLSHNITPARYFWASDPVEAVRCELARTQLGQLAPLADTLAGVSAFNAAELRALSARDVEVIPVLFDPPPAATAGAPPGPTVLFVGRLVPHKRQDLVIRAFARWQRREPAARLVLVGTPLSPAYAAELQRLADALAPGAVRFESGLPAPELWRRYRDAVAFLCLSEHEGFCIPLLEAFAFEVPVIARDAGAVAEVVGDAAVLLDADDSVATVAELLAIVAGDGELRAELAARGRRRLDAYDRERVATTVRATLQRMTAGSAR